MKMTCLYCQGAMKRGDAPFKIDRPDYHLILARVPAWICGQCGEPYSESAEVDTIQEVIRAVDEHTRDLLASA